MEKLDRQPIAQPQFFQQPRSAALPERRPAHAPFPDSKPPADPEQRHNTSNNLLQIANNYLSSPLMNQIAQQQQQQQGTNESDTPDEEYRRSKFGSRHEQQGTQLQPDVVSASKGSSVKSNFKSYNNLYQSKHRESDEIRLFSRALTRKGGRELSSLIHSFTHELESAFQFLLRLL